MLQQKVQSWQLEKIREQADKQTNKVTLSLLELLVAAKNIYSFEINILSHQMVYLGLSYRFKTFEMSIRPFYSHHFLTF